jgi:hypothetical protein
MIRVRVTGNSDVTRLGKGCRQSTRNAPDEMVLLRAHVESMYPLDSKAAQLLTFA